MRNTICGGLLMVLWIPATTAVAAANLGGRSVAEEEPSLALTLSESSDGGITGTLAEPGTSMPLSARRQGDRFAGTVGTSGAAQPFTAFVQGERVVMEIGAAGEVQRLAFRRAGSAPAAAPADGQRHVVINDRRYSDEELAQVEQAYRIRIPDADYWYDPVLGAWGGRGGRPWASSLPGSSSAAHCDRTRRAVARASS